MHQLISTKRVSELNQLGIFLIPDETQTRMAYYVLRSWGHYLFFPHPGVKNMYPFFKSQGGIYKVFDHQVPFPYYNGELFKIFGASTIGSTLEHHPDFLVEEWGVDYGDPDLNISSGVFELVHKKINFRFLDLELSQTSSASNEFSRDASID